MSNSIGFEQFQIGGTDFTFVTQENSELLRANVILPFDASPLVDGTIGHETPHLLEHLVCQGSGKILGAEYTDKLASLGGYTNAFTVASINGRLWFETTQPDSGLELVEEMVESVFNPALSQEDIALQREVVRNELSGYLQDPIRQRSTTKNYTTGIIYKTEALGLETLDAISQDDLRTFHTDTFNTNNTRIVLAGSPENTEALANHINHVLQDVPAGERMFSASQNRKQKPDYHADAQEIPAGRTDYMYCRVSEEKLAEDVSFTEFRVVANAFYDYFQNGKDGVRDISRNRGLSYDVKSGWQVSKEQISLSVNDTTSVEHVAGQIALMTERLGQFALYDESHFESFRKKEVAKAKIYPDNLLSFTQSIEGLIGVENEPHIITPNEYRQALQAIPPRRATEILQGIVYRLANPNFVLRSSFGDNPF